MVQRACEQCSATFNKSPAAIKRGEGRFCSNDCRNIYVREHIEERSGENAPLWKGGVSLSVERYKYYRKWAANNRHKSLAHWRVKEAVKTGRLTKQPCEQCGSCERVDAHHDDYLKPLDVRWLCRDCHAAYHASLRSPRPAKPRDRERQYAERAAVMAHP